MKKTVVSLLLLFFVATVANADVVLTFEGLGDNQAIGNYYDGGGGGNYGIDFSSNSLALIATSAGGSGNFSNAPTMNTVAYFLSGGAATMNVASGFDTGFSFYYADQVGFTGTVNVWDGLNGTGNLLASITLPTTPNPYNVWVPIGVSFSGLAHSVDFGGSANYIGFDNITVGAATPGSGNTAVPEPSIMLLFGSGLAGLGALRRRIK